MFVSMIKDLDNIVCQEIGMTMYNRLQKFYLGL